MGSGSPLENAYYIRSIERRIQALRDFTATIPLSWWQEGIAGGRKFDVEFCSYSNGLYSPIALASLVDEDNTSAGSFLLNTFSSGIVTSPAPLSGDVLLEISRENNILTITFRDSSTQAVIVTTQNTESDTFLNCIRLRFTAIWGEAMGGNASYPSHSKIWIDYIEVLSNSNLNAESIEFDFVNDIFVDPALSTKKRRPCSSSYLRKSKLVRPRS